VYGTAEKIRDFDTSYDLISYFDTEEKCVEHLAKVRWNGEPTCPHCESKRVGELKGKANRYKCYGCRKKFSVRVGTIFQDSKLPLRKWFIAIFIFSAHKRGISSHQLARDLGITQNTAWFVLHRIREVYKKDDSYKYNKRLRPTNPVEVDEAYLGGRISNKHGKAKAKAKKNPYRNKIPVVGIIQRNGKVIAVPVKKLSQTAIRKLIYSKVATKTTVYTDNSPLYHSIYRDYDHHIVNHSANEYVRGKVHTNNIENFWSHL
jgi:transposase-like protein